MAAPVLVMQMQRMGDLVLTFPLLLWLRRVFPDRPLWVLAEKSFFEPLMPIGPEVFYVPWEATDKLRKRRFSLVANLSHEPKAAALAGELDAEERLGPVREADGAVRIRGDWQLYRAALVHNNRYNRFHWADLNALDLVPLARMAATRFAAPRTLDRHARKVGLFLGASEAAKRPGPAFWAELVRRLLGRDLRPVLFGGPAEAELGREVARLARAPVLDLCGRLDLTEFAALGETLALFVTPDTGPMHLAAWTGLKTLNLSMGNVHPWETGPYNPGHFVLRADLDCARGCWTCERGDLACHGPMDPARISALAARLAHAPGANSLGPLRPPGLGLFTTGRGDAGLYRLERIGTPSDAEADSGAAAHALLAGFWQAWFGHALGLWDEAIALEAAAALAEGAPKEHAALLGGVPGLGRTLGRHLATRNPLPDDFWSGCAPQLRPFTGFVHLLVQNGDHGRAAWARALALLEALAVALN